jgi:hypothetical protein
LKKSKRASRDTASLVLLVAAFFSSCASSVPDQPMALKTEKPFAAAGSLEMQLDGGNYEIRPASGDRIRISFGGNTGNAAAEVTTAGAHANVSIKDTPNNFKATIEVPQTTDLVLHLTGANLDMAAITGNKDIDCKAGNVGIAVSNANEYSSVDASVKVGNLDAGPFGKAPDSGMSHHFTWSGSGKYTLRVSLGVGNLDFKSK